MTIHVFVGPTLSRSAVVDLLPAAMIHGPVGFGDVYRVAKERPKAIVIIDGYFERMPAVWHKEILWAMAEGVHVFGASSMGALRAAELADFGMIGIGSIFEDYRDGILEDDDEVSIAHASEDDEYRPLSEAMTNIRATITAATEAGILDTADAAALVTIAKDLFYRERSYPAIFADERAPHCDRFRAWLGMGKVDRKADDARAALTHARGWLDSAPSPMTVSYRVEPTDAWLQAVRSADAEAGVVPSSSEGDRWLVEELMLSSSFAEAHARAALRATAVEDSHRMGFRPDDLAVSLASEDLRRRLNLIDRDQFLAWCNDQRLGPTALMRLLEDEARVIWARSRTDARAFAYLADSVRTTGEYATLLDRAERKTAALAGSEAVPSLEDLRVNEEQLWTWFFARDGHPVPLNLSHSAAKLGYADVSDMRRSALRELAFERAIHRQPAR